jgi:large subunit ribosomal protein L5
MTPRLKERYLNEIKPELIKRFGYKSPMQAPRLEKITLNMGVGDAKLDSKLLDNAAEQLAVIAGQKPAIRRARKSIANFKLRQGMPVGVKATLRGDRMWEMLDRLESIAIPRIRDFRGLSPRSFDGRGNYSLGVREQIIFPEIDYDSIDQVRGLDIAITTTAETDEEAFELLRLLGMPFRRPESETPAPPPARAPAAAPSTNGASAEAEPETPEAEAAEPEAAEPEREEPETEEPEAERTAEADADAEATAEEPAPDGQPAPEPDPASDAAEDDKPEE